MTKDSTGTKIVASVHQSTVQSSKTVLMIKYGIKQPADANRIARKTRSAIPVKNGINLRAHASKIAKYLRNATTVNFGVPNLVVAR